MDWMLSAGTLLDERYRIIRPLAQGGFGITYQAENIRLGMQVAIKELFWSGHCARSEDEPERMILTDLDDAPLFATHLERFLREARILRDFADQPGVVRILDYFEANATAYIVMELIEGDTLKQKIAQEGPLDELSALRLFLPLARSLSNIHRSGLIHRDISPDNIMVRRDGSLTLIDFGAAREVTPESPHTAIGKKHFSAPEQYDRRGKQGPWTDVYGFCATLYHCLTGVLPDSAVQRMFLDELRAPSSLAQNLSPETDGMILRGMDMDQDRRFQSMDELADAILKQLPREPPSPRSSRRWWIPLSAAFLCILLLFGILQYTAWKTEHPFYGVETMRFLLTPGSGLSARDYAAYQEKLKTRLNEFAGADQYRIRQESASLEVTLPASVFGEELAVPLLESVLFQDADSAGERAITLEAEVLVSWEDPASSLIAGEHQVLPSSLKETTLLFVYECPSVLSRGQRANLITDLKSRLDALETPYAFGLQRGSDQRFVFRIAPAHIGRAVLDTIGSNFLYLGGSLSSTPNISCYSLPYTQKLFLQSGDSGSTGILYQDTRPNELEELSRLFLAYGEDRLCLKTSGGYAFLEGDLTETVSDGSFLLDHLRFADADGAETEAGFFYDYLDVLINQTELPEPCYLREQHLIDPQGRTLLGQMDASLYGLKVPRTPGEQDLVQDLLAFEQETGIPLYSSTGESRYWLHACLPLNAEFPEKAISLVHALLENASFSAVRSSATVYLLLTDEQTDGRCRLILSPAYDAQARELYQSVSLYTGGNPSRNPYVAAFLDAWHSLDVAQLGYRLDTWSE